MRTERIGENGTVGTHIKHVEGCPPCIEIKFVRLGFHLNKIKSNGLEFNIYACGCLGEKGTIGTHIKHIECCSPGREIEFVSLGFHLNKIESNRLEP